MSDRFAFDGRSIALETVTPQKAKQMLETVPSYQRRVRKLVVNKYAAMMEKGQWVPFASELRFDVDGCLQDGQHRLEAQVVSGTTQGYSVMRGCAVDDFRVVDSGTKRSIQDRVSSDVSAAKASMASAIVTYDAGAPIRACVNGSTRGMYATDVDVSNWIDSNLDKLNEVSSHYTRLRDSLGRMSTRALATFYRAAETKYDVDDLAAFLGEFRWDSDCTQVKAVQGAFAKRARMTSEEQFMALVRGFEMYVRGYVPRQIVKCAYDPSTAHRWRKDSEEN